MGSPLVGIVGVGIASTFWGSNFIVCKGYKLPDDGMHFVLLMSVGILFVGICTLFTSQIEDGDFEVVFAPDGLLGGAIWALGNFLTVPIVSNIGLGMGLAIWAGVSLIVAFVVGWVGMGSLLPKEALAVPAMGAVGISLAVGALFLFSRLKPTLDDSEDGAQEDVDARMTQPSLMTRTYISHTPAHITHTHTHTLLQCEQCCREVMYVSERYGAC